MSINRLKTDFEKNSMVVFVLMMVANVCNYAYQIVMGNALTTADYGNLNALLSLSVVISVPAGVLQLIATKHTAYFATHNEMDKARMLFHKLLRIAAIATVVTFVVGAGVADWISSLMHVEQKRDILTVVAVIALSCIISVTSGTLQGAKRFIAQGFVGIIGSLGKLVFGVFFVWLGLGLFGNMLGLLITNIVVVGYSLVALKSFVIGKSEQPVSLDTEEIKKFFHSAFWVQLLTAILINGDMVLVRSFVSDPAQAGLYASSMVIGKIPMYMATAVVTVLFPMVVERQAQSQDTRPLLARAMLLGGGIALLFAVVLNLAGARIILFLFGERYALATEYLLPICCFVFTVTLISILMNYFTARGETKFFTISLGIGYVLIVVLIWRFHATIEQMMYVMSAVLFLVLLCNLPHVLKRPYREKKT